MIEHDVVRTGQFSLVELTQNHVTTLCHATTYIDTYIHTAFIHACTLGKILRIVSLFTYLTFFPTLINNSCRKHDYSFIYLKQATRPRTNKNIKRCTTNKQTERLTKTT